MAEGTYEYECMRAELLGIEKPDYDEFIKNHPPENNVKGYEEEAENLQELDHQGEQMRNITGGLDELNTILKSTQKKIHTFKAHCGSLTNILRFKIGSAGSSTDSLSVTAPSAQESSPITTNETPSDDLTKCNETLDDAENQTDQTDQPVQPARPMKSDLARALEYQEDKLDRMIEKAENAQYSMTYQIKEMKKFIRK